MYNIQNTSGKNVALMLERGGFVLKPAQYLDLDKHCSRAWIRANKDVQKLLAARAIRLVHDSEYQPPKVPVHPITRYVNAEGKAKVVSTNLVEVVDLSAHPDVEVDSQGRVHCTVAPAPAPQAPVKEVTEPVQKMELAPMPEAVGKPTDRPEATDAGLNSTPTPESFLPLVEEDEPTQRASLTPIPAPKPETFIKNRIKKLEKIKGQKRSLLNTARSLD